MDRAAKFVLCPNMTAVIMHALVAQGQFLSWTKTLIPSYMISGGIEGKVRLRVLYRTLQLRTLRPPMACGSAPKNDLHGYRRRGFDLAWIVGPNGKVVEIDFDETKLELA